MIMGDYGAQLCAANCASLLQIAQPSVEVVAVCPGGSPAATNDSGSVVLVGEDFLEGFGDDYDAVFATMAHEIGHVYWLGRSDWADALTGHHYEDGPDFTAGQLMAAGGHNLANLLLALCRVLQRYDAIYAKARHRDAETRCEVITANYAAWALERRFW